MPCPGSSPRRLTLRIGWARKALSTSYLQIPLPELGDFPARRSLLGRLTRRRRKPAVGNTVLRPGHAKLLWAVDPGQTRVQARRSRQSRGTRRALALQAHKPPRRQRSKAGARLSCCQSALVRVYPLPLVVIPSALLSSRDAGLLEPPERPQGVSGRSPGEGNGNLLQYSCLENSIGRGF